MPKPGINLTLGTLMLLVVFGIASVALYGAAQLVQTEDAASADAGGGEDGSGGVPGGPVAVRVVAKELKFDKRSLAASPGASVTITLDNQDAGVIHNLAVYTNNRATQSIVVGPLAAGPIVEDIKFTAPSAPGNYFYRCDAHPDTMTGTFSVR
jgi:plastocyanin